MPPATTTIVQGAYSNASRIHPDGVIPPPVRNHHYTEENDSGASEAKLIQQQNARDAADDFRPCFVPGTQVVDPRSWYITQWEYVTLVLLLWTATVTPFEVGFLKTKVDGLFFINRFIDACFLKDVFLNFRLAYFEKTGGRTLVTDTGRIGSRYVRSWFVIDVISTMPFEMLGLVIASDTLAQLKILRIVRLLRLFKLIKILRSAAILQRWQSRVGIKYSVMSLAKYMTIIVFVAHWMGCCWHVVTRLEDEDEYTWVKYTFNVAPNTTASPDTFMQQYNHVDEIPVSYLYCASLYHATMTLTTIGYGDVIATTDMERWFSVLLQLVGASLYAYIVGVASGIVASMNKEKMHFQETMDELNDFMEDQGLSDELTVRLREFFTHNREMEKLRVYNNLLARMSPGLRGEVAMLAYGKMLESVPYFSGRGENFITAIAVRLTAVALSPGEAVTAGGVPADSMYFVADGVVSSNGLLASIGYHCGDELVLASGRQRFPVRAITFCSLHVLTREALTEVLLDFPKTAVKIRKSAIRMAFRRDAVKTIQRLTAGESGAAGTSEDAAKECLSAMQVLQQRLLEKDSELQMMLDESIALQSELQQQLPQLELHMAGLHKLKTSSDKTKTLVEKEQLQESLEAAKDILRLQEQLATESASKVKAAQYKFWKARQVLVRNAISDV